MGAKMVAPTKITYGGVADTDLGCKVDADCYKTLGGLPAATTDAEKKDRCCMYFGVTTAPSGTNKADGELVLSSLNTSMGVPTTAGEATKICMPAYPTFID